MSQKNFSYVQYPSQYRRIEPSYPIFPPVTTRPKKMNYSVVTPSSIFPTPPPPPRTPQQRISTAGLYQNRLRSPRPLSCIAGIGSNQLSSATVRMSTPPAVPGYVPPIPAPLQVSKIYPVYVLAFSLIQARFERDYMSLEEVGRRGSVYL